MSPPCAACQERPTRRPPTSPASRPSPRCPSSPSPPRGGGGEAKPSSKTRGVRFPWFPYFDFHLEGPSLPDLCSRMARSRYAGRRVRPVRGFLRHTNNESISPLVLITAKVPNNRIIKNPLKSAPKENPILKGPQNQTFSLPTLGTQDPNKRVPNIGSQTGAPPDRQIQTLTTSDRLTLDPKPLTRPPPAPDRRPPRFYRFPVMMRWQESAAIRILFWPGEKSKKEAGICGKGGCGWMPYTSCSGTPRSPTWRSLNCLTTCANPARMENFCAAIEYLGRVGGSAEGVRGTSTGTPPPSANPHCAPPLPAAAAATYQAPPKSVPGYAADAKGYPAAQSAPTAAALGPCPSPREKGGGGGGMASQRNGDWIPPNILAGVSDPLAICHHKTLLWNLWKVQSDQSIICNPSGNFCS